MFSISMGYISIKPEIMDFLLIEIMQVILR